MPENPLGPDLSATYDNPLGGIELTSVLTFGVREAALAGVAVSPGATAGQGGVFADTAALTWTAHITCSSITFVPTEESIMDRPD
jgi:hypothetical protein